MVTISQYIRICMKIIELKFKKDFRTLNRVIKLSTRRINQGHVNSKKKNVSNTWYFGLVFLVIFTEEACTGCISVKFRQRKTARNAFQYVN